MLRKVAIAVAYDGRYFHGFQRQPNLATIEGFLLEYLGKNHCFPHPIGYSYTGRTDKGVSSLWQTITMIVDEQCDLEFFVEDLNNSDLPIVVWGVNESIPEFFDARKSALWREYLYIDSIEHYKCVNTIVLRDLMKNLLSIRDFYFLYKDYKSLPQWYLRRRILKAEIESVGGYIIFLLRGESFPRYFIRRLIDFFRKIDCSTSFYNHIKKWVPGAASPENLVLVGAKYPFSFRIVKKVIDIADIVFVKRESVVFQRIFSFLRNSSILSSVL